MDSSENQKNKVSNGDIEFALFLAESESEKESESSNFVVPSTVFKVYIETTTKDDGFDPGDESFEISYNVYVVIDGMYFMVGQFDTRQKAARFAANTSIKLEKNLKTKLISSLSAQMNGDLDE